MSKVNAYHAVFIPNEGKVSVFFPDVPGCFPWGDTFEEAFADAVEGLAVHLEGMADDGDPIPAPSGREEVWAKFQAECMASGDSIPEGTLMQLVPAPELDNTNVRINVSIKRYLLERIDRKAEAAGMTRSGFLAAAAARFESQPRS